MSDNYISNEKKASDLEDNYRAWKVNSMTESGYFLIFQGFVENDILKSISGNALKLYMYLGIKSNNFAGVVWHSNEKIAAYFEKSERTIRLWMKELEDKKLIKRMRLAYDGIAYTFLLPYKISYSDKYLKKIEGFLVYKNNKIYIKTNNEYLSISNGIYMEVYDNITDEWIFGKIYTYRYKELLEEDNNDIKYIFKGINCVYEKALFGSINIKVRTTI